MSDLKTKNLSLSTADQLNMAQQVEGTMDADPGENEFISFLDKKGLSIQTIQSLIQNGVNTMYAFIIQLIVMHLIDKTLSCLHNI